MNPFRSVEKTTQDVTETVRVTAEQIARDVHRVSDEATAALMDARVSLVTISAGVCAALALAALALLVASSGAGRRRG